MKTSTKVTLVLTGAGVLFGVGACKQDPKDPKCECKDIDHWSDKPCCTNNDNKKTNDCECNTVAVASDEHTEGTVRYKGNNEHEGCQVMFNGELVRRNGDDCKWTDGLRPIGTYGDIDIFAVGGVDTATATAKAADFNAAMAGLDVNDEVKAYIAAKVSRIEIVAGVSTVTLVDGVLRVGANVISAFMAGNINTCIWNQPGFAQWEKDNGFAKVPADSKIKIAHNWQKLNRHTITGNAMPTQKVPDTRIA